MILNYKLQIGFQYFCSFGQPAIFLVGGVSKETKPIAMYVRSGDIAVMSGPSRLAYHAVPKILSSIDKSVPKCFHIQAENANCAATKSSHDQHVKCEVGRTCAEKNVCGTGKNDKIDKINEEIHRTLHSMEWTDFDDYLRTSRINMNVRQVLKPGHKFPEVPNKTEEQNQLDSTKDVPHEHMSKMM